MKALLTMVAMMVALSAEAQIRLGHPALNGDGCPMGTTSATLTDDGSVLSILFDAYSVEAGNTTGRRIDRRSCNLRLPISVGPGYQVGLLAFDYRGFAAIPSGGQAVFTADYSYVGQVRPASFSKMFYGPQAQNYSLVNELISQSWVWSKCTSGTDLMLAVNTNIRAIANNRMEQTMLSVDSLDVQAGLLYKVALRRCQM